MFSYNRYALLEPTNFPKLITRAVGEVFSSEVTSLWFLPTLKTRPRVLTEHVDEDFSGEMLQECPQLQENYRNQLNVNGICGGYFVKLRPETVNTQRPKKAMKKSWDSEFCVT